VERSECFWRSLIFLVMPRCGVVRVVGSGVQGLRGLGLQDIFNHFALMTMLMVSNTLKTQVRLLNRASVIYS
jgi:hypothetical protein